MDKNLAQALKLAGAAVVAGAVATAVIVTKTIPDIATREDYPEYFPEDDASIDCS